MVWTILVKTLDSQNYRFESIDQHWSIKEFKVHIQDTVNVPADEQRLIFCGRVLQDCTKLVDCDCNDKVIHLVRKPPPQITDSTQASSSGSETINNDNGPNIRVIEDGNFLFGAMTLSPIADHNQIFRRVISLRPGNQVTTQQRPHPSHSRTTVQGESATQNSNIPRSNSQNLHEYLVERLRDHSDWIPIIEEDISKLNLEQSNRARISFSDAYLSSIPRKKRRLLMSHADRVPILQPSPPQAITNLLRRAITNSGVSTNPDTLNRVLSSISNEPEVQEAYEFYIKELVERRIFSDSKFKPEKFKNSHAYYKS